MKTLFGRGHRRIESREENGEPESGLDLTSINTEDRLKEDKTRNREPLKTVSYTAAGMETSGWF